MKFKIKKPSLMDTLGERGLPEGFFKRLIRFFKIFIILTGFFIIVFNLVMEWLAIAIDSPLMLFGIFFYIFIVVRRVNRFKAETLLYRLGKFGEGFYSRCIEMLYSKNRFMLILSGILVLHLVTDVGNFIVPYTFGIHDLFYFQQLGLTDHIPVYELMKTDFSMVIDFIDKFSIVWLYVFNVVAILFLLLMPAFIWYTLYKQKTFNIPKLLLALFYTSVACLIFAPIFGIRTVSKERLVGVDIWTANVMSSPLALDLIIIVILSILIGSIIYISSISHWLKKRLEALAIAISLFFFGLYVYYFFIDSYTYYINMVRFLIGTSQLFLAIYFLIFTTIILIFYVSAFITYLSETTKGFRYMD